MNPPSPTSLSKVDIELADQKKADQVENVRVDYSEAISRLSEAEQKKVMYVPLAGRIELTGDT
jgi:hypothetical protein